MIKEPPCKQKCRRAFESMLFGYRCRLEEEAWTRSTQVVALRWQNRDQCRSSPSLDRAARLEQTDIPIRARPTYPAALGQGPRQLSRHAMTE
jgi:hypothetical protein